MEELLPIVLGAAIWGSKWKGVTVSCLCDNAAVVAIVNSGRSKMNRTMHLMRCLSFFLARMGISMVYKHILGAQNELMPYHVVMFLPFRGSSPLSSLTIPSMPCFGDPRLDKGGLDSLVQSFFIKELAQSTHKGPEALFKLLCLCWFTCSASGGGGVMQVCS